MDQAGHHDPSCQESIVRTGLSHRRSAAVILAVTGVFLAPGAPAYAKHRRGPDRPRGSDVLLSYHRVGGMPPSDIKLTIRRDGRATRVVRSPDPATQTFAYAPQLMVRLRRALSSADFAHARSSAEPPVRDGYVYELSSGGRTVDVTVGHVPKALLPLIALFDERAHAAVILRKTP
jgi:hypothetical protein